MKGLQPGLYNVWHHSIWIQLAIHLYLFIPTSALAQKPVSFAQSPSISSTKSFLSSFLVEISCILVFIQLSFDFIIWGLVGFRISKIALYGRVLIWVCLCQLLSTTPSVPWTFHSPGSWYFTALLVFCSSWCSFTTKVMTNHSFRSSKNLMAKWTLSLWGTSHYYYF